MFRRVVQSGPAVHADDGVEKWRLPQASPDSRTLGQREFP